MSLDKTSSSERLSFTVFLAFAFHAIVILGISFTVTQSKKASPTLNITLATHKALEQPEDVDFLAQYDQEASGTIDEVKELTTREQAEIVSPNINQITPVPQQKTTIANINDREILTAEDSTKFIAQQDKPKQEEAEQTIEAQEEDTPMINPEIASLRAKLDKLQQEFARRPRIRRMTSVATKSSYDAAYLNKWTQRVEVTGNQNFPEAALDNKMFGALRLSVIVNADGTVDNVEVLEPSGFPILDQAALQIVRLASPFDPFPPEILKTADQLDIIRTWRFELTGLKTAGTND